MRPDVKKSRKLRKTSKKPSTILGPCHVDGCAVCNYLTVPRVTISSGRQPISTNSGPKEIGLGTWVPEEFARPFFGLDRTAVPWRLSKENSTPSVWRKLIQTVALTLPARGVVTTSDGTLKPIEIMRQLLLFAIWMRRESRMVGASKSP